jgi:membrane-associated phospholipid phosphatase
MVIAVLVLLSLTAVFPNDGLTTTSSAVASDTQAQDRQPPPPAPAGSDTRAQDQQPQQPAPAGSDAPAEEKKPPRPPHTGIKALVSGLVEDVRHVPSPQNGYLALVGGGLALAAHQVDTSFNRHLKSNYTFVNTAFAPAKYFGGTPIQTGLALGTYAYGRAFHGPKVAHLGMDLLRAQLLTEGMVHTLKLATQRERPDGSNHQSFPSGHAAITFAGATVLERHLGWKHSAVAYALATYVAASRLHDDRHYLSDVAFGAAVGVIGGRTVTQHGRQVWTLVPVSVPGGMAIIAMRTP